MSVLVWSLSRICLVLVLSSTGFVFTVLVVWSKVKTVVKLAFLLVYYVCLHWDFCRLFEGMAYFLGLF